MIDMKKLRKILKQALFLHHSQIIANIDTAVNKLQSFLRDIVDKTVPWAKSLDRAKPFWNDKGDTVMNKKPKATEDLAKMSKPGKLTIIYENQQ